MNKHPLPAGLSDHATGERQFCTFHAGGCLYGVDILTVREINAGSGITPIHHAPPSVRGYVNIRGQLCLVLNLHELLGRGTPASDGKSGRLLLFKDSVGPSFGALVDRVGEVISVSADQIEHSGTQEPHVGDASGSSDGPGAHTLGVCKLPGELMVILDPAALLATAERQVAA